MSLFPFSSPPPCQVFDGEDFVYGDVLWADAAFHGGHCRDEAHHLVHIPRVPASTSGAGHVLVSAKAREAAHGAQVCLCVVLCWRCPSPQYGVGCEGLSCIPKVLPIGFQHSHIFQPPQCPQVSPLQVGQESRDVKITSKLSSCLQNANFHASSFYFVHYVKQRKMPLTD